MDFPAFALQADMDRDRNLNALWLRCLLEEVRHSGAQDAVVSPGGRSLALCLEIRHSPHFRRVIPHTDERSGAFLAMGLARTANRPVVIVTTSGSAVANLLPALTEASALRIPLILLTCDRLHKWRGTGYGQMTDHIGACRAFAAASLDLADPSVEPDAIMAMRAQVSAAIAQCLDPEVRGIAHINIPLEGHNDSTDVPENWQVPALPPMALSGRTDGDGVPMPMHPFSFDVSGHSSIDEIAGRLELRPGLRGAIVAGPQCPMSHDAVSELARVTGYPVVADAASGLRRPGMPNLVSGFDVLATRPGVREQQPELVIRLGLPPVLPMVENYLLEHQCRTLRIAGHSVKRDYLHADFELLVRPENNVLDRLGKLLSRGDADWLDSWRNRAARGAALRRQAIAGLPWGEVRAAYAICNADGFDFFHFGNSMPIRNADICMEPSRISQAAFSNRGVNGIDGTIGTFIGELIGSNGPGLLLLGDQAFLHDLPALSAVRSRPLNGCICVLNNGGGAIFDFLGASRLAGYQETIRAISDIDIGAAAACFRLPFHRCQSESDVHTALESSRRAGGLHIIEAMVPPRSLVDETLFLYETLEQADDRQGS